MKSATMRAIGQYAKTLNEIIPYCQQGMACLRRDLLSASQHDRNSGDEEPTRLSRRTEGISGWHRKPSPAGIGYVRILGAGLCGRGIGLQGLVILFPLLTMLAACGGGGGSSTPTQSSLAQPASQAKSVSIEAYGDSTQYGWTQSSAGVYTQAPDNAPSAAQKALQSRFGELVTVTNCGVSGSTAESVLAGTDGSGRGTWAQQMAASKTNVVYVNYGINEAHFGITASTFQQSLDQMITIAQSAGKTVVLETPNPTCRDGYADAGTEAMAGIVTQEATNWNLPLIDTFAFLSGYQNWCSMLSDGVHPTDATYLLVGQLTSQALSPIVSANL